MMYLYFIRQEDGSYIAVSSEEYIEREPFKIIRINSTEEHVSEMLEIIDRIDGALDNWRSVMLVLSKFCR